MKVCKIQASEDGLWLYTEIDRFQSAINLLSENYKTMHKFLLTIWEDIIIEEKKE